MDRKNIKKKKEFYPIGENNGSSKDYFPKPSPKILIVNMRKLIR
jgi:hypothetical protein